MMGLKRQTIVNKKIAVAELTAGSDLPLPNLDSDRIPLPYFYYPSMNKNTNFILRQCGIFSNFADGLVPKEPCARMLFSIGTSGYDSGTPADGTISISTGNHTVTGVGTSFLSHDEGDIISIDSFHDGIVLYTIDSITNDTTMTIVECPVSDFVGVHYNILGYIAGSQTSIMEMPIALNHLFDYQEFIQVTFFSETPSFLTITPRFFYSGDISFLTNSISPAFDGNYVGFDFVSVIDYTD